MRLIRCGFCTSSREIAASPRATSSFAHRKAELEWTQPKALAKGSKRGSKRTVEKPGSPKMYTLVFATEIYLLAKRRAIEAPRIRGLPEGLLCLRALQILSIAQVRAEVSYGRHR